MLMDLVILNVLYVWICRTVLVPKIPAKGADQHLITVKYDVD